MEENIAVQVNEGAASPAETAPAQDFDAMMRQRDFQSEFDRRVSRALETARGKWAQDTQRKIEQARAEAEALARMSGEERMAHQFAQREAQLNAREQEILRRELRADAIRMARERGLPEELAGVMDFANPEQMEQGMDAVGTAFHAAVQSGVEARMRGMAPAAARHEKPAGESDADYYRARFMPGK